MCVQDQHISVGVKGQAGKIRDTCLMKITEALIKKNVYRVREGIENGVGRWDETTTRGPEGRYFPQDGGYMKCAARGNIRNVYVGHLQYMNTKDLGYTPNRTSKHPFL